MLRHATLNVGYAAAGLDPSVTDRWGRRMELHGGSVEFTGHAPPRIRPLKGRASCAVVDTRHARELLTCSSQDDSRPSRIRLRQASGTTTLSGAAYPKQHGRYPGHWGAAFFSPSGDWVFAQWSGECEVPSTYLINIADRTRTPVGRDAGNGVPETLALGWTSTNLAVAWAPTPACGTAFSTAGVYLIRPPGEVVQRIVTLPERSGVSMWGG